MQRGASWPVAVACALLCGCSGGGPQYKYRVAVIPKGLTHEFWQSIHRGADRAAADLNAQDGISVKVLWDGPLKEDDARDQIDIVNRNLGTHVSGIVLAPQDSGQMVAPVERAHEAGIPVVIIDSGLARQDIIVKYISTDNYNGGRLAAEHLLKVLRAEGKAAPRLVLFRYQTGSESTEQREKGFEDVIGQRIAEQKKAGQPPITWLSRDKYAGATVDSAEREAAPLISRLRNENVDAIFAPNESSATGVLNALRSQGLNKKVRLMGFDSSEPLLQALKEDDVVGLVVQDPYRMGYLGVWTLVRHLEGDDVRSDGKLSLSTGEYVVTKANLGEQSTRELFTPELQQQRTIQPPAYARKR